MNYRNIPFLLPIRLLFFLFYQCNLYRKSAPSLLEINDSLKLAVVSIEANMATTN